LQINTLRVYLNEFNIMLDRDGPVGYILNMFKTQPATGKGEQSRSHILECALGQFRRRGFDETRMRDIALQAGVALGAAYYYFPSKDAIIQAYYESVQAEHERRVAQALAAGKLDLRQRLGVALHAKLDIVQEDRRLLGAIFRYTGEPEHPLSCLGPATEASRRHSIAVFAQALGAESLPKDLRELLPLALWALHMGLLVYFIYDHSPDQQRTRKLVDGALDLIVRMLLLAKSPLLKPVRGKLLSLLRDAGLLSEGVPGLHPVEEL
jgi:AcrR family transcriptional regulator